MSHISRFCLIALFAFISGLFFYRSETSAGEENDNGYRRQYLEAEKKVRPDTCSGEGLVKYLNDDSYFVREVASDELQRRGIKHLPLVIDTAVNGTCETRARARRILGYATAAARTSVWKDRRADVKLTVSDPRFWSGANSYLGGQLDSSLDSNITFSSDVLIENIVSPMPIKHAVTDNGEKLWTQVWASSRSTTSSYSLFLNRPNRPFKKVDVTVIVCGFSPCNERYAGNFEVATYEIRKGVCTLQITNTKEGFVVEVLDVLGRLDKSELTISSIDSKQPQVKVIPNAGSYRFVWTIPLTEKEVKPEKFEFKISGAAIPVEHEVTVTVPSP